ncbi:uncharacterized protein FA14DRAFT_74608 [Meira miltonrushii]|uniref:Uncharacterized protein n=1 Tax=Meira miltonrushii TaxID=1280837 RepID=A0A316V4N1_9BASI|nr:uncharacterized protein FA14DRAFT_74608 [Meira miltonrushii]PWN32480.1 hypothetical protein FA14DRAFT_74608 [Meira miltonrushii]
MAASLLSATAKLNDLLLSRQVHSTIFPYAWLPTLHALRIAFIHTNLKAKVQQAQKANQKSGSSPPPAPTTFAYDLAGFLIMAWGGGFLVNFILGQTPMQLLSIHPFLNYAGVYVVISTLSQFVNLPAMKMLDTAFIFLDGSLRSHAVIMSVLTTKASINPAVQNSLFIQILCGTIGATGGGQLAGMLSVISPQGWSFSTPPFLRATTLVEVIDIIAASVCATVFGITTLSHPAYSPVLARVYNDNGKALFTPTGARAACTIIFALAFAYRATVLHWLPAPSAARPIAKAKIASSEGVSKSAIDSPKRSSSPAKRLRNKA